MYTPTVAMWLRVFREHTLVCYDLSNWQYGQQQCRKSVVALNVLFFCPLCSRCWGWSRGSEPCRWTTCHASAAMGNFSAVGHSFFALFPDCFWEREGSRNDSSARGSEGKLHMCRKVLIWPQWTDFTKTWAFAHSPEWLEMKAVVVYKKNLESCPELGSVDFPSALTHHHCHGSDLSHTCWKVQTWYLLIHSNKTSDQENRVMACI